MMFSVERVKDFDCSGRQLKLAEVINPKDYGYQDLFLVGDVTFVGSIKNTSNILFLEGTVELIVELTCNRCNTAFQKKFVFSLEEKYSNNQQILETNPEEVIGFSGDSVDIAPEIIRQLYLELPMSLLCKPDCAGLCVTCGANLNNGECFCSKDDIDPRLEKLRDFIVE